VEHILLVLNPGYVHMGVSITTCVSSDVVVFQ